MFPIAHIAVKGLGDIANGALHPFVTPSHLLLALASALLLGQGRPFILKLPMLALALCGAAGVVLAGVVKPTVPQPLLLGFAAAIAAYVAMERPHGVRIRCCVTGLAGFAICLDSAPESIVSAILTQALAGSWIGICAGTGYLAICFSHARERVWARIALRVAAAWIIAIALLVLAFHLRPPQKSGNPAGTTGQAGAAGTPEVQVP